MTIPRTASTIIQSPRCAFNTERKIKSMANNPATDKKKKIACIVFIPEVLAGC
ncbi:MAG: hypothetical protein ABIT58_06390 [Ferruginibacter sp.]